ncbi:MAG: glutamate racemase [candidate division WOR-3 bacterium]|nr:MAG: glutamate racemase [candidate division WOR-3 bacterium]
MKHNPIGVFDSGIGGLTVVKAVKKMLPREDIIYLGDTARLPYGTKSVDAIIQFSIEDTQFLVDRGAKYIVIACYSSASVALDVIRKEFSVPVIGVIQPGVRKAMEVARTGKIGVIGTSLTIYSGAYEKAFKELGARAEILGRACPLFVPLVEEGWVDHAVSRMVAQDYLEPLKKDGIDTLLLGCTHYPLLMKVIRDILGDINYVDASTEVGVELAQNLRRLGLQNPDGMGSTSIYLTDLSMNFKEIGERFLGEPMKNFSRVSLKRYDEKSSHGGKEAK